MNFKKFTCLVSFLSTTKTLNTLNIAFITLQWHQKNQSRRSIVSSKTKQNKSRIRQPFKIMMKKAFASNELSDWNTQKQSWCIQVFWILLLFFLFDCIGLLFSMYLRWNFFFFDFCLFHHVWLHSLFQWFTTPWNW